MLSATFKKNDRKAYWLIGIFSLVVFIVVVVLGKIKLNVETGFDVHVFAKINAVINSLVAVLLVWALIAVKSRKFAFHKKLMMSAMVLSILFLVSYIAHHLLSGDTLFGDINHDAIVDISEKMQVGGLRTVYLILLSTHIFLASIILPFILFTAYRGLIAEWPAHRKLAKYTWPLWLYVAITGPIIYWMISPFYQ